MEQKKRNRDSSVQYFLIAFISLFMSGCMTLDLSAPEVRVPVMMNSPKGREYIVISHFSVEQDKSFFFIKRLVGGAHPDINGMLQKQLRNNPGDAIINFRIKGVTSEIDIAVPILLGIVGTFVFPPFFLITLEPLFADLKSYTLEGDVIQFTDIDRKITPSDQIDPDTGLPVQEKKSLEYDPETGLPKP